ncbi:hypothetical protein NYA9BBAC_00356 [Salinibacterium sp. NYA9b]
MKLTLSYIGPLPATQGRVSKVKATLREHFHPQIKAQVQGFTGGGVLPMITSEVEGHGFVSPAHDKFRTAVELDVLLLTPPSRRPVGDPDNRLKTLIDGLTRPANSQQMQDFTHPSDGGPTYCLMDDDFLVKRVGLESRVWHSPEAASEGHALVIVTATIVLGEGSSDTNPFANIFFLL